jgi:hypothetical protein
MTSREAAAAGSPQRQLGVTGMRKQASREAATAINQRFCREQIFAFTISWRRNNSMCFSTLFAVTASPLDRYQTSTGLTRQISSQ